MTAIREQRPARRPTEGLPRPAETGSAGCVRSGGRVTVQTDRRNRAPAYPVGSGSWGNPPFGGRSQTWSIETCEVARRVSNRGIEVRPAASSDWRIVRRRYGISAAARPPVERFRPTAGHTDSAGQHTRRYGIWNECPSGWTVSTGHGDLRTTRSATLPSSTWASPERPCVPMIIRSISFSRA